MVKILIIGQVLLICIFVHQNKVKVHKKYKKNKDNFDPLWLKKQEFIIVPKENVFLQEQGKESQACDGKIVQRNKTWDSIASL